MFHYSMSNMDDEGLFPMRGRSLAGWIRAMLFGSSEKGVMYDPSDLASMFQDSAGTTAAVVGQPVGLMLDKSGNGYHATQLTSTARPILEQDATGHYYLKFDGVDDFMVTPSIDFSATDKISVFAGVRKLSDAAAGIVAELGTDSGTIAGTFRLVAPPSGGVDRYSFASRGTAIPVANATTSSTAYNAPNTSVLSGIGVISSDTMLLRVNGVQAGQSTNDQGTGNFANLVMYIGMRAGTTVPFNGHLYSLVVRGALSDAAQITAAETYVNSKTGAY